MEFFETKENILNQIYSQEIQKNEEATRNLIAYRDKHEKVAKGLKDISGEVSIDCMVPIGKKALMRGKLQHTNEILTSIGDGYFVKYSNQQAIDLCKRRIERVEAVLKKFEQERDFIEKQQIIPTKYGAFQYGQCQDICEPYNENEEKEWKVQHREREREYYRQLKQEKDHANQELSTDDELFRRLDELELEEELEQGLEDELHEASKPDSLESKAASIDLSVKDIEQIKGGNVSFGKVNVIEEESKVESNLTGLICKNELDQMREKISNEKENIQNDLDIKRVTFKEPLSTHVELLQQETSAFVSSDSEDFNEVIKMEFVHSPTPSRQYPTNNTDIRGPHDLYKIFQSPKSILKPSKVPQSMSLDDIQEESTDSGSASTYQVLVRDVRERNPDVSVIDSQPKKKKPSRFKLERAGAKKR